jgi:hypothetical protein
MIDFLVSALPKNYHLWILDPACFEGLDAHRVSAQALAAEINALCAEVVASEGIERVRTRMEMPFCTVYAEDRSGVHVPCSDTKILFGRPESTAKNSMFMPMIVTARGEVKMAMGSGVLGLCPFSPKGLQVDSLKDKLPDRKRVFEALGIASTVTEMLDRLSLIRTPDAWFLEAPSWFGPDPRLGFAGRVRIRPEDPSVGEQLAAVIRMMVDAPTMRQGVEQEVRRHVSEAWVEEAVAAMQGGMEALVAHRFEDWRAAFSDAQIRSLYASETHPLAAESREVVGRLYAGNTAAGRAILGPILASFIEQKKA